MPRLFSHRPAEILVRGAAPGEPVNLVLAKRAFESCPEGVCRPDKGMTRTWTGTAAPDGTAAIVVHLGQLRGDVWWRAASTTSTKRSAPVQTTVGEAPSPLPATTFPDRDGDDLTDRTEAMLGTDPTVPDSDGDGRPDGLDPHPTTADPADPFRALERPASDPSSSLKDPEFHSASQRLTWQDDSTATVWIAGIDPDSGSFLPLHGRGEAAAQDAAPMTMSRNGPEWVDSDEGPQIAFVRTEQDKPYLARAWQTEDGTWMDETLPIAGVRPLGSTSGMVRYFPHQERQDPVAWARIDGSRHGKAPRGLLHGRWSPDGTVLMLLRDREDPRQLVGYDIETEEVTVWTEDPHDKGDNAAWAAPEAPGAVAMLAVVSRPQGGHQIGVYRREDGKTTAVRTIPTPPAWPYVVSPEVLVYGEHSYVVWLAAGSAHPNDNTKGHILLASAFDDRVYRVVSDGPAALRKDPEAYTGGSRPWVYYSAVHPNQTRVIRRCELGLKP